MKAPLILVGGHRGGLRRALRWWVVMGLAGVQIALLAGAFLYGHFATDLPPIPGADLRAARPSVIHARDGRPLARLGRGERAPIALHRLPPHVIEAFLAIEDQRFFRHAGVDLIGTGRAVLANWLAGQTVQGASTLTQQLCKVRVGNARTYARKAREAILARRTEQRLSKPEILALYLDTVYLGQGAYGIEAAARRYFGRSASTLSLAEAALLAGLPPRPSALNPVRDPAGSKARRAVVLARMVVEGFITAAAAEAADAEPIALHRSPALFRTGAPHAVEQARLRLDTDLFDAGWAVHLSLDAQAHAAARDSVNAGLEGLAKRQGFRGPITVANALPDHRPEAQPLSGVQPARIEAVFETHAVARVGADAIELRLDAHRWMAPFDATSRRNGAEIERLDEALAPGMVVLVDPARRQVVPRPLTDGAFVSLDWRTGAVTSLVGGRDFDASEFHRVFQGCRQPGSAFKPFIYGLALDAEYTLASPLDDTPLVWSEDGSEYLYKPRNAGRYAGDVLLLHALAASKNVPAIRLLSALGGARVALFAQTLGIESPLHPGPALALGSSCVRPWELTRAMGTFATNGRAVRPWLIGRVLDAAGRIRLDRTPPSDVHAPMGHRLDGLLRDLFEPAPGIIDARTAWLTRFALRGAVRGGTASGARRLGVPVAGKTGTTDAYDAWFTGMTAEQLATVWIGSDRNQRPLGTGETGAWLAVPIWVAAMRGAIENVSHGQVVGPSPPGIEWAPIDAQTGELRPIREGEKRVGVLHLPFKSGTQPIRSARRAEPLSDDALSQSEGRF